MGRGEQSISTFSGFFIFQDLLSLEIDCKLGDIINIAFGPRGYVVEKEKLEKQKETIPNGQQASTRSIIGLAVRKKEF